MVLYITALTLLCNGEQRGTRTKKDNFFTKALNRCQIIIIDGTLFSIYYPINIILMKKRLKCSPLWLSHLISDVFFQGVFSHNRDVEAPSVFFNNVLYSAVNYSSNNS